LLGLGIGKRGIETRMAIGWLIRIHNGVYAVGHGPTGPLDRARGALLAAGERSALRGRSAAAYWGLYERWVYPLQLISPLQRRIPGLDLRRSAKLIARDIRRRDGIRVTSPARTMLDIAPYVYERTLHRFHNELRMRQLITNELLIDVARRNRRHPGARRLLMLAGASSGNAKRSQLEIDWQLEWARFARRHPLPPHEVNVHVAGHRVDVLFVPDRLILELDGWATHGTPHAFEDDRSQDAEILALTGIPTLRITRTALRRGAAAQCERILAILQRR
jgi:very-short-patch-repair endonuclease